MDHDGDGSDYSPAPEEFLAPQTPTLDETLGRVYSGRPLPALYGRAWLLTLLAIDFKRGLTPKDAILVDICALYWHFVDVVWIAIFTLVYLIQ